MKKWLLSLLVLLSISVIVACGKDNENNNDEKAYTVEKVQTTYVQSPLNVPSIVEKEKGLLNEAFAEEGIEFGYSNLTTGP